LFLSLIGDPWTASISSAVSKAQQSKRGAVESVAVELVAADGGVPGVDATVATGLVALDFSDSAPTTKQTTDEIVKTNARTRRGL
jgi:hypothetical protein